MPVTTNEHVYKRNGRKNRRPPGAPHLMGMLHFYKHIRRVRSHAGLADHQQEHSDLRSPTFQPPTPPKPSASSRTAIPLTAPSLRVPVPNSIATSDSSPYATTGLVGVMSSMGIMRMEAKSLAQGFVDRLDRGGEGTRLAELGRRRRGI